MLPRDLASWPRPERYPKPPSVSWAVVRPATLSPPKPAFLDDPAEVQAASQIAAVAAFDRSGPRRALFQTAFRFSGVVRQKVFSRYTAGLPPNSPPFAETGPSGRLRGILFLRSPCSRHANYFNRSARQKGYYRPTARSPPKPAFVGNPRDSRLRHDF